MKFQKMKVTSYFHFFCDNMLVITYLHIEWRNIDGEINSTRKVMEAATLLFGKRGIQRQPFVKWQKKQE